MLVSSRRSLILGITSLVAAPSLVRATSLMELSGFELDPRVVAFYRPPLNSWSASVVNEFVNEFGWAKDKQKALRIIKWVFPRNNYEIVRTSELSGDIYNHGPTKVLIEKCVRGSPPG